ncbi:hypothetical protein BDZ97DRAFT_1925090 [Flammula alnicola]|nr:hypothetical protein BDZ97DRAFT_1925090 [Flammula alnicola]
MVLGALFNFSASSSTTPVEKDKRASISSTASSSDSESTASGSSGARDSSTMGSKERANGTGAEEGDSLLTPATSNYNDMQEMLGGAGPSAKAASDSTPTTPTIPTPTPSYTSIYTTPPPITYPYTPAIALSDLPGIAYALELFLSSKMFESEAYCRESDVRMERLYFATGYGLIQCVKGLMSYEDDDLLAGIAHTKQGNLIANAHRKKAAFFGSRLAGYVVSAVHSGGNNTAFIKSMTDVERHAELVYAESLFEKALLGIMYSGDWLAFIKEALNMRTTISIYRQLGTYIDAMDASYASSSSSSATDPSIDAHFRSGVYLGVGMSNIILSLMPGKLMTLVELFGYHGDRRLGLEMLMRAGGWVEGEDEPRVGAAEEGVRRSICDMALLIFHLVLSSFTFDGVDVKVASKILKWNLKRYPNGVFFLFGAGRLGLMHSQPRKAIEYYTKAMEVQKQYRNLHHISFWEIAIANLALWDLEASLGCWRELEREATWSKSIYSYGMAVCLLESGRDDKAKKEEAAKLMEKVPSLRQKIAGKSIPMEKLVARKARKFHSQHQRLALPALEMAYLFQGITHAPRTVIVQKMLPEVDRCLTELGVYDEVVAREQEKENVEKAGGDGKDVTEKEQKEREKRYFGGEGYWDDYCLAMFLRGVCMRYVAYPDPDAELDPTEELSGIIPQADAARASELAFRAVFEHGPKIDLDHHLVYHAHYELGRLLSNLPPTSFPSPKSPKSPTNSHHTLSHTHSHASSHSGGGAHAENHTASETAALEQFELILSGKYLEVGPSGRKGKYSMENALVMRTHAAVAVLGKGGRL